MSEPAYGLLILQLNSGQPTPFDGRWVAAYDPSRPGVDPNGAPMLAHLECTDDPAEAMRFVSVKAAYETWRLQSGHTRADGRPDRPMTAFTVVVEEL